VKKGQAAVRNDLHARFRHEGRSTACKGCEQAARALLGSAGRVPRARRSGEPVEHLTAAELDKAKHFGRIIQTPGHRGYLRHTEPEGRGVYVCTTSGVCTYPPDTLFSVWGP
jgi:hypothetical protein